MVDRSQMRAADTDRERVAEILRDAHTEGRLSQDELLERVDSVYTSRTFADLDRLIYDLPVVRRPPSPVARRAPGTDPAPVVDVRGRMRRFARAALTTAWWVWGFAVSLNTVIWVVLGITERQLPYPWPLWVALPWALVLAAAELLYRRAVPAAPRS